VAIGRKLDLVTIAEGIETVEQLTYLHRIGCDDGQGFLLAVPMPHNELKTWLQRGPFASHDFQPELVLNRLSVEN
jgi:EAL domain-containing protein (putative c-di-GMP-specific phosphodiesterase class I)